MIALMGWSLAFATDLAVRGAVVHPVSGPPIENGVVLVDGDRIEAVGPAAEVAIPEGVPVISGAVVTPGLVDGLSTAGLTGVLNHPPDQDHREVASPRHPELRAIDGFDPWERLVGWVRDHGTTTMQVGPSPGPVVAGRAAIVSVRSESTGAAVMVADGAVVFSLGEVPKRLFGEDGVRSRMGAAAVVRQALTDARAYAARMRLGRADRPTPDLGLQALADVLQGKRRAIFHAHRADDLLTALRIAEEFDLRSVLAGAAEAYLVRDAIRDAGVPVLVGPVMLRGWRDGETANASFRNAALLDQAGVSVGFMSGYEAYVPKVRVLLWEAGVAASHGLGLERALHAATLGGATVLGVDGEVGSLQAGKRADLVVYDGDPFEYTTHVCTVVARGQVVSRTCR